MTASARAKLADQIQKAAAPLTAEHQLMMAAHAPSAAFFVWHRDYIDRLEGAVAKLIQLETGKPAKFKLPRWDPAFEKVPPGTPRYSIPPEFLRPTQPTKDRIKSPPALPFDIFARYRGANLDQFENADALAIEVSFASHTYVHLACGGVMADVHRAAEAPIFWPWHGFIDDIWEEWKARRAAASSSVRVVSVLMHHFDGDDPRDIRQTLEGVGLTLGTVRRNGANPTHHHLVTRQDPMPNANVPRGTPVNIWLDFAP